MTLSEIMPLVIDFCEGNDDNVKSLQHALTNVATRNSINKNVAQLTTLAGWNSIPACAFDVLRCTRAKVFVQIMLKANKAHFYTNGMVMLHLWKKLTASGQEHILTYIVWKRLYDLCIGDKYLSTDRLLESAALGQDIIAKIEDGTTHDMLKMKLCTSLAISDLDVSAADIKVAWRAWAKEHHPDHGGDIDIFISVKTLFELWSETND